MTLTLLLLRHGKSNWAEPAADIDRPINRRGRKAAKLMGRFLTATDQEPDLAITSPARRARQTLDLAHRSGAWSCQTVTEERLYGQGPAETIQVLRTAVPPTTQVVLAVGHEPTCSAVVEILTGADVRFPTAAVARIDLDLHRWDTLAAGTGRLTLLLPPRLLATAESRFGNPRSG